MMEQSLRTISQGSKPMFDKWSGLSCQFITHHLFSVPMKAFWKSVNIL